MINDQLQKQVLRGNGHITEGDQGDLLGQDRPSHSIDGILGNFIITVILTVTALMALSSWSSSHAMRTTYPLFVLHTLTLPPSAVFSKMIMWISPYVKLPISSKFGDNVGYILRWMSQNMASGGVHLILGQHIFSTVPHWQSDSLQLAASQHFISIFF